MDGLQVLSLQATHDKLAEFAVIAELPWAVISKRVYEFADKLRDYGVFFTFSDDPDAVNRIQPELQAGRDCYFTLPSGNLFIHACDTGKKILEAYGAAEMGILWKTAQPHLIKFMDVLYSHNMFIARGDEAGVKFLDPRTRDKTVSIRIKGE